MINVDIKGLTIEDDHVELNEDEVLEYISIDEAIDHYGESELLEEMGYNPDLCFGNEDDIIDMIEHDDILNGVKLEPYFRYSNDKEIYSRFVELLQSDLVPYEIWDEFLKRHE